MNNIIANRGQVPPCLDEILLGGFLLGPKIELLLHLDLQVELENVFVKNVEEQGIWKFEFCEQD